MTSVGDLATFSLPRTTLWLSLRITNILLCFTGMVGVSGSTGDEYLMPSYSRSVMVRVTDLT